MMQPEQGNRVLIKNAILRFRENRMLLRPIAVALLLATGLCAAQQRETGRPIVGLALEGGGALGLAHIGVLLWMEEHRIPVDRIAGTSMGSLVGGLYAEGMTPAQLRALATGKAFTSVFTLQQRYTDIDFRRREDRRDLPTALTVGLRHGAQLRNALFSDEGVNAFLLGQMPAYNTAALDFDQMPIPFRCVATDLNTLAPVVFARGPLPTAIRASISIPAVFPPVIGGDGHALVDGGIVDNLPTDVVRRDLHAQVVIAVHLEANNDNADIGSVFSVLNRAFSVGIAQNERAAMRHADLLVRVPLTAYNGFDYDKGAQLVEAGYKAAEAQRAALEAYALDPAAWQAYLEARRSRIRTAPGRLRRIEIVGGNASARASVAGDLKPLQGQPIAPDTTLAALKSIEANGVYQASYETFAENPHAPDAGLLIRLRNDAIGPPYLLLAPDLAGTTNNLMRFSMHLRLVAQDLGGFGSELRATAQLGYKNGLNAEYYKRLSASGYFIEPQMQTSTEPVYIWQNQTRVAERSLVRLAGGASAGRTFSNALQILGYWRFEDTHWNPVTGSGGGPFLSGTAQSGGLKLQYDHSLSSTVAPDSLRLILSAGALYHAEQSETAPMLHLDMARSFALRPSAAPSDVRDLIGFSAEINSTLRSRIAEPYRFTLGGPLRLSSASFDEYRGTDDYLARAAYLHRIAALPTGLGQGLYATFGYEAGEVWSPEQRAFLRQNGILGLIGNTPLGLVTFGTAIGDAGRRKVFFTIGRWY